MVIDKNFQSNVWIDDVTGTGSVVYGANPEAATTTTGDLVTLAGDDVSRAMKTFETSLAPGETIEFNIMCRIIDGSTTGQEGNIYIESPPGTRVAELNMTNEDWERSQTLRYTAEFNAEFAMRAVKIFIGSSSTRNNTSYFTQPVLRKYGSNMGTRQTFMDGVINISAVGVGTVDSTYTSTNIDQGRITAVGGTSEIKIMPHGRDRITITAIPMVQEIRGTVTANPRLHYEARALAPDNAIQIAAYDASGALQDINNLGFPVRLAFSLEK